MNETEVKTRKKEIIRVLIIGVIGISVTILAAYFGFFGAINPFDDI